MSVPTRQRLILTALLLVGAIVFSIGINWGLPSRDIDPHLFATTKPWTGQQFIEAGGAWSPDPTRPADAATRPTEDRSKTIWLNETPKQQADIIRRYRLFSAQPDEMVTFMALAGMRTSHFDPRMYQYGGLWIYPVGALLKAASIISAVELKPDFQTYLDHPEAFGRFYIVARIYSAVWGLVGIAAVFHLVKRFSNRLIVPTAAAACFLFMPVVINAAHEAKPHLAGAVLVLLTVLAAVKYVETALTKWWIITGITAGLAVGMVLSSAIGLLVIPLMTLLRSQSWKARAKITCAAVAMAIGVYCLTNPFVPINLLRNPAVVRDNFAALSNAKAISGKSTDIAAIPNARRLIIDGASMVGGVTGLIGLLIMAVNHTWWRNRRWRNVTVLLGVPSFLVLIQFTMLAAGKQGEFGRFFILPDVALVLLAVVLASCIGWGEKFEAGILVLLVAVAGFQGLSYLAAFLEDARGNTAARTIAAARLKDLWNHGARTLAIRSDPAPYCLPPIDITAWRLQLLPYNWQPTTNNAPDVIVTPVDEISTQAELPGTPYTRTFITGNRPWLKNRITWADKPFEILVRREMIRR